LAVPLNSPSSCKLCALDCFRYEVQLASYWNGLRASLFLPPCFLLKLLEAAPDQERNTSEEHLKVFHFPGGGSTVVAARISFESDQGGHTHEE
jgi:hypothetical protein